MDESGFEKQTFRTNAIGAIREGNLFALRLFICPIDGDIFHAWLSEALLPELEKPTVIVMDNAAFHK